MITTYTYKNTKNQLNVEHFDTKGYVTLTRDGNHVYEHQFSTTGVRLQELQLQALLIKHNVEYKTTKAN